MAFSVSTFQTLAGAVLNLFPTTVTIENTNYTGTRKTLKHELKYKSEGFQNSYQFSVVFVKSDFSSLPSVRSTCSIDGTTYRILSIEEDGPGITVRFDMGEQYAN